MERGASCECGEGAAAPSARTWNWSWTTRQSLLECSAQALVHAGIRFGWEGMRPAGGEGGRKSKVVIAKFKSHRAKNPHSRRPHTLIVVTQLLQRSNQVLPVPTTSHSASQIKTNFCFKIKSARAEAAASKATHFSSPYTKYRIAPLGARGSANGVAQSLPSQPQKQSQTARNVPAATTRPLPLHCKSPVPFHNAWARSTCDFVS